MTVIDRLVRRGRTGAGATRVERRAQERRRRAMSHLERVRNHQDAFPALAPRWGLAPAMLGASLLAGAWLAGSWVADARLESLSVQGAGHLSAREIAGAAGLEPGTGFGEMDRSALVARLVEHTWIEEARALPLPSGRLLLAVVEREPVAILAGPEERAVDATGTPFAPAPAEGTGALPRLVAAEVLPSGEPAPGLAEAVALARRLPEHGLPEPQEIGIAAGEDPEGLSLRLPDLAPRVVLGWDGLEEKLDDLARLLEAGLPELATATRIDLRFRGQAVLDVAPPPKGAAQAAASRGDEAPSNARPSG
jgi:hypothetical protein